MSVPHHPSIACNEEASRWMHRGIDLMNTNVPENLGDAVRCFDQAIALRLTLPLAENPQHRYALAAGWMNRGDALTRLGEKERLAEALKSYDEALGLLRTLPLEIDPLYPRRMAIAWINRGFTSQMERSPSSEAEAIRCFREALAVLEDSRSAAITDLVVLRAGALSNLAGALLDTSTLPAMEARGLAQQALALVQKLERTNATAAEASFKARHVLCRAVAEESRDGKSIPPALLELITDTVDDGLALARYWEQRGATGFQVLAEDLFRFGCRIYQTGQPHFLAEFILESLDPQKASGVLPLNPDNHEAAVDAIWGALKEIQRGGFTSLSTPRFEQLLENLRTLRVTEERLEQLQAASVEKLDPKK